VVAITAVTFARPSNRELPQSSAPVFDTALERIRVTTVAEGLEHPWSLAFLPNGDILVTERVGRLRVVRDGVLDPVPVAGVPQVYARLHGGLLDIALHPDFATNQLIYFTYTLAGEQGATVAVARGQFDGYRLSGVEDVFVADAWSRSDVNFGSRIAFGPDGTLYMSVGERNEWDRAQDRRDHAGSIVRIHDDGSVPSDNPFMARADSRPEIYSYGHRNVQGLAIDPVTGILWANEHGPQGGDEVNVVLPGGNYGWPLASLGRDYTGEAIADSPCAPGTEQPGLFWTPSIGVSGMTFYTGHRLGSWMGNLFVGGLSGQQLQRVLLAGISSYGRESLLTQLGLRIRDVREGPDESLYVVTDEEAGVLLKIEPADPLTIEA
jgi:glucose/arabinose dehydrogenase